MERITELSQMKEVLYPDGWFCPTRSWCYSTGTTYPLPLDPMAVPEIHLTGGFCPDNWVFIGWNPKLTFFSL